MHIPVDQLTKDDYRVLRFVRKQGSVSGDEIKKKFGKLGSIDYRISVLAWPTDVGPSNAAYLSQSGRDGTYSLSRIGLKILEDHISSEKETRKKERTASIRYLITTAIAVLALIVAVYALYLNYTSNNP
jgi:hypothetical protein